MLNDNAPVEEIIIFSSNLIPGNETGSDYYRMMKIVLENGYNGYVGIEYEGTLHSEIEGIHLTNKLLKN